MKKIFLFAAFVVCLSINRASAQGDDELHGVEHTYYDSLTHKKVKEIYQYQQLIKMMPDKKHYGQYRDTIVNLKNGPYTYYYENGNVQYTGFYNKEKKDSIWRYYDAKGTLLKTEKYRLGQLVK